MRKKFALAAFAPAILLLSGSIAHAQDWDRAVSLFNQKQYRPAIKEFHAVVKTYPDYWQSWYYIGAGHFHLQGYEDSIDAFQNYIKGAEKDDKAKATGYYFIGFSHYQLKRYDQAIGPLNNYLALSERAQEKIDPTARAALGRCYIFTDKFSEAIAPLQTAATEQKTNANNYYYLGYAHNKLGRTDQAIAALNQALALTPRDADTLALLGDIQLARSRQNPGALKQAIDVSERLLAVEDGQRAWGLLGQAYLADKQYAKAAPLLQKFAQTHKDSAAAWLNLGLALSRSDQLTPAAEALGQASKLAPNNLGALLELGYVYERDKQPEKALAAYEQAYRVSGNKDETAKAGIDRLKQPTSQP